MTLPIYLFAQEQEEESEKTFSMSAQIRPRAEYRNGAFFPRSKNELPASFINNRTRLSMDFKRDNLILKMSAQHVSVWGQDPQIDNSGRFMLNESWAKINCISGLFAQVGRQQLAYDDERILGTLDWNVSGRYHDLLKLGYESDMNKLHLAFAYNQTKERVAANDRNNYYPAVAATAGQPYKYMQTLWYHFGNNNASFNASILLMNLGIQAGKEIHVAKKDTTKFQQTIGTYLTYKVGDLDVTGSFYYQMGQSPTAKKANGKDYKDYSAYMINLKLGYKITPDFYAYIGYDLLSGQDVDDKDKITAFDPLYGTHHKYYGTMDYFYVTPQLGFTQTSNTGLVDYQVGLTYKASNKADMSLNYHYLTTAQNQITQNVDIAGGQNVRLDIKDATGLGHEIDFQFNYTIMKDVRLMLGYSFMLGTETMDVIKGGNHEKWQDWGWISLNINPQLFVTKWR
jgi:hypothetical protein